MASAGFVIRIKTPAGTFQIPTLSGGSTIKDLKVVVEGYTGINMKNIKIYCNYPPKLVTQNENEKLSDVDIRSGDTLIIRVEEDNQVVPVGQRQTENGHNSDHAETPQVIKFDRGDALSNNNGIMMRHDVPSNNSCLFTSIYFILNKGNVNLTRNEELRNIIAEVIRSDPAKYNSAYLSRENSEYCSWILNPNSWGGAIELAIFSEYFKLEFCAIDIICCKMHRFGEGNNYRSRGLLIYDGIHYDPLVMHLENEQRTIFPVADHRPLDMAMEIAKEAQSSRQYTDIANFKVKCNVCQTSLRGEQEATAHAKATGHAHFGEL